ncbi:glycosyltransferase family 2 protein [Paraburkholderia bryophila]|uniref:Cellulose synthase/poly-beta-1,6-N-acetylglucosamine synthase-like glycosyltransferase n=1 Tax=Paraburkholderia bryophila TaxID=420952 RepID=A0A7Y9WG09_9BURK|nr:glycosyltransferase [Paraburkholderia bryophila]NYH19516.1 cellulose synthase/poly-beta-1,6-N-acetylglucosamine synthase-like glycosyltransferase [Paraburkholderia bryophila]
MPLRNPLLKVSVIVPTYRRPVDLARCLAALQRQSRAPDEVIVVARTDDAMTHTALRDPAVAGTLPLTVALVDTPGQVAALNRGLDAASGDVLAITDDDAAPHADWVARIAAAFEHDPRLGGLGGRDWVHEKGRVLDGERQRVGKITAAGMITGNHHLGVGDAREVDILKGANMSYRRDAVRALRFDVRLRGTGAQVHNDMAFSLSVKHAGWKLMYDPRVAVDHYPAERFDDDQRFKFNDAAFYNASFNLRLIMCETLTPSGRWAFVAYSTLIGNRADPGFVRALSLAFERGGVALALRKWWVGLRAMRGAWQEAVR